MDFVLYLPDKKGNHKQVKIPEYIKNILIRRLKDKDVPRIVCVGCYRYRIYGYNPQRPSYGIYSDMEKFKKWAERYFTTIEDIKYHEERKNYYVEFTMYDVMAQQLERHNLIR